MRLTLTRWMDLLAFVSCVLFLVVAAYLQYRVGLVPCPLCIIQRFLITFLGIAFLMGGLFNFSAVTRCCLHTSTFLLAVTGAVVASRQLWLEHFVVEELSSCQAILEQSSRSAYLHKMLELFFQGTSNCGSSHWHFLKLSLPMWTLLFFIFLAALALHQIYINRLIRKRSALSIYKNYGS